MVDTTFYQGFAQQFTKKEALLLLKQRRDERLHDKMEELERETKRGFNEEDWEKEEREKKELIERQKKDLEKKEKLMALELEKKLKEQQNNEEENANQDNSNEAMADFLKNQRKRETNAQRQQRLAAEKMNEMMEMRERHFEWKLKSVSLFEKKFFEILVLLLHHCNVLRLSLEWICFMLIPNVFLYSYTFQPKSNHVYTDDSILSLLLSPICSLTFVFCFFFFVNSTKIKLEK